MSRDHKETKDKKYDADNDFSELADQVAEVTPVVHHQFSEQQSPYIAPISERQSSSTHHHGSSAWLRWFSSNHSSMPPDQSVNDDPEFTNNVMQIYSDLFNCNIFPSESQPSEKRVQLSMKHFATDDSNPMPKTDEFVDVDLSGEEEITAENVRIKIFEAAKSCDLTQQLSRLTAVKNLLLCIESKQIDSVFSCLKSFIRHTSTLLHLSLEIVCYVKESINVNLFSVLFNNFSRFGTNISFSLLHEEFNKERPTIENSFIGVNILARSTVV